ncbi:MAG: O-antigen ligase family protein, partial [Candidatus Korobacteraceae bacterium]
VGICLLLAFCPLAFGAVDKFAMCVLEAGAGLLLITWAAGQIALGQFAVTFNPLFVPALLFGGLIAIQLLPGRSAYWYATWEKSLLWCAFGILLFLTSQCLRQPVLRKNVGLFFTVFGFLVALFAIVQSFIPNGKIYWVIPNQSGWPFFGPYINHSHYAGLMEMLIPFPLVFAMTHVWRRPVRVLFGFVALIMASTIFLSQSLGGILGFTGEILVLGALLARGRRSRQGLVWLVLLGVFLAVWLSVLRPVGLMDRLTSLRSPLDKGDAGIRAVIVKDCFKMVRQRPLLGWGLGTFPTVYPAFRSFYSEDEVNEAHNDFIQILVETGVAGFGLMVGFIILVYRGGMRSLEHWRRDPRASVTMAALVGCTGLLIHSLSDFNLQIPANAALFFALTAIATTGGVPGRVRLSGR